MPGTTILSSAVNANFTDIATGLSDCLTRDNQAGMTAIFRAVSGSVSAPGITFNSDTTSGLYLSASGAPGFVAHSLGMILNTNNFVATSATVSAGGSGYVVGDTITATGGTAVSQPVFQVATLSGSAVATVTVAYPGSYSAKPSNPVAQGSTSGVGTGCTLTVAYNDPSSSDYRAIFTDQAAALIWQKMGSSSFMSGLMAKATAYDVLRSIATAGSGITFDTSTNPPTVLAPAVPINGSFRNLSIKVASTTTVTVAADAVIVSDGTNYRSVVPSSTINLGTNGGVNALDTGTIAVNTWYYIWVIAQTVTGGTVACLASTSSTAPTMPTGYTYKARIGAVQTIGGAATLYQTWQLGNQARYIVGAITAALPQIALPSGGSVSAPTFVAKSVVRYVPTTASFIALNLFASPSANNAVMVAPNNSYGAYNSTIYAPPMVINVASSVATVSMFSNMMLESTNLYYAADASAGAFLFISGWTDNL